MTFADGVLRLVRIGARIDTADAEGLGLPADRFDRAGAQAVESATAELVASPLAETGVAGGAVPSDSVDLAEAQLGLDDLEAAVALVAAGLATRVVLAGFPSWPGLLWRAYELADAADVLILPTVVRPGGKVDIVITGNAPANG
jgi:hypothetical protein